MLPTTRRKCRRLVQPKASELSEIGPRDTAGDFGAVVKVAYVVIRKRNACMKEKNSERKRERRIKRVR